MVVYDGGGELPNAFRLALIDLCQLIDLLQMDE